MFKLKLFGDMVLSFVKKRKSNSKGYLKSRLRTTLFVQPLLIVVVSFAVILGLFNLTLTYFINEQAKSAVQKQFDILNNLYLGDTVVEENTEANIFQTTYMILDDKSEIVYTSASLYDEVKNDIFQKILNYMDDHELFDDDADDDEDSDSELQLDDSTYLVNILEYKGEFDNYYIRQSSNDEATTYYILVFADITAVKKLDTWINILLLILMVIIGLFTSLFIYLTSRKLDRSFDTLRHYIQQVGQRQDYHKVPNLPYKEFDQVVGTVEQMSQMIDANQRSQQIFFQNSSHELRTPLMSIQGYAEGIKEGVIKDHKQAASVIYSESQKMTELVDDILTLSKLENTQNSLAIETLSVTEILYDISWRLKKKADDNGVKFYHHFSKDSLDIQADEKLLGQALINIVSNAVRYAHSRIDIVASSQENKVCIQISNDGPEISQQDKDHIFERFYKGEGGQFGIGLSMSKDIIEHHRGCISMQSDQNETMFTIYLPICQT